MPHMADEDYILGFHRPHSGSRGRFVRLGATLDRILRLQVVPDSVARLLGEAALLATALGSTFKVEGTFSLQVRTDGPVSLLVADVTSEGVLRGTVQCDTTRIATEPEEAAPLLGDGYLAFTADPAQGKEQYQGIVRLEGRTLAKATEHYFRQSEQIPTAIEVALVRDAGGLWRGAAMLLQKVPGAAASSPESPAALWEHDCALFRTLQTQELTDFALDPEALLYRLFHQEGVVADSKRPVRYGCRCSEERVGAMLRSLPRGEIEDLAVDGIVTVTCEFCNRRFPFTAAARAELFTTDTEESGGNA